MNHTGNANWEIYNMKGSLMGFDTEHLKQGVKNSQVVCSKFISGEYISHFYFNDEKIS